MSADTTPGATYVSQDGLVSYGESGRRLDGLGNETWGGYGVWDEAKPRYSAPVQNAIDAYQREVAEYERQMAEYLANQPQPGLYSMPQTAATWRPAGSRPTLDVQNDNPWRSQLDWRQPQQQTAPGYTFPDYTQPQRQPAVQDYPYQTYIPAVMQPAAQRQPQPQPGYTFPDYRPSQPAPTRQLPPAVRQPAPIQVRAQYPITQPVDRDMLEQGAPVGQPNYLSSWR